MPLLIPSAHSTEGAGRGQPDSGGIPGAAASLGLLRSSRMDHRVTGAWTTSPPAPCPHAICPREGCRGSPGCLLWGLSRLFCSHDSHLCETRGSVAAGSPRRLQWIWICRQLWAQKDLPGLLGGSYRGVWSPLGYVRWEGTQPSSHWEYTNPCMHISTLLFSKPLTGPRLFLYLAHCLHIRVTPNRGTYLLLAPLELKLQWDKALGTGQSWSFFPPPPKIRRAAPLLLSSPAPSALACSLSTHRGSWHHPRPLRAWPRWVSGARHGIGSEGPLGEDHGRDKVYSRELA